MDVRFWHLADICFCTAHVRYSGVKRTVRRRPVAFSNEWAFGCGFVPLAWRFVQRGYALTPPALDSIGCLISATNKRL